ncbi:Enoyl-CoA hydratase/isomerase [Desulfatibacillum aliphaticivorans]|uniref:Enoyl-CoA hydratase/isomerase n=1 Tax=Desulfatibacillum aliphaticivorans TaxID=218208 RepID=B8FIU2_DESAL|nr:enoyl-CoA hydratase-related protein [Desulfatibacillum aliphaticivorans]ACL04333.1 Enoyl-CoA hydratase/isomerase [Desulfatibacillum aliphaticivorans]
MDLKYVLYSTEDGIAWIRLNRPDKLNALNHVVFDEIGQAVAAAAADDDVRVVVLTGSDKVFAAGADIEHMSKGTISDAFKLTDGSFRIQESLADIPKPTIAAISGYALGGGLELALCCDFRIASETAVVGLPEINLGIIPGGGGTQRLPRLINYSLAAEMVMTGGMVKAEKAERYGILNRVVPQDQLMDEVKKLASKLMSKSSVALRAAKTAMRKGLNVSLKDGLHIEQDLFCMLFGTEDQKEGMAAFLEKRKAEFKGK